MTLTSNILHDLVSGNNTAFNDYWLEIARGNIRGMSMVVINGRADAVPASKVEVWAESLTYTFPTSSVLLRVSSSNTNDAFTAQGAKTVTLDGLNSSFSRIIETIQLSGTTLVTTTGSFYRLNHVEVEDVGTLQGNVGTIRVHQGGTNVLSNMPSGSNHDWNGIYTVPSGSTAYICSIFSNTGKDSTVRWSIATRESSTKAWHPVKDMENYRSHIRFDIPHYGPLTSGSDIKFSAERVDGASATLTVNVGAYILLVDDRADDLKID